MHNVIALCCHHSPGLFIWGSLRNLTDSFALPPPTLLQWYFGAEALTDHWRRVVEVIVFCGVSLSVLDSWAIGNGIWAIDMSKTAPAWLAEAILGPHLPLEEALFFLLASTMCAGGLTLANIITLHWHNQRPGASFTAACAAVHNWGCRQPGRPVDNRATHWPSQFILACSPLAAVAHYPAETGLLVRQLLLTLPLSWPMDAVDDYAIAVVAMLRTTRLVHVLLSVPICARHLASLHLNNHATMTGKLLFGNLLFTYVVSCCLSTCYMVYLHLLPMSRLWSARCVLLDSARSANPKSILHRRPRALQFPSSSSQWRLAAECRTCRNYC